MKSFDKIIYKLYNPFDRVYIGFEGTLDECVDWMKRNKMACDIHLKNILEN